MVPPATFRTAPQFRMLTRPGITMRLECHNSAATWGVRAARQDRAYAP
jgi:hypothetical protein